MLVDLFILCLFYYNWIIGYFLGTGGLLPTGPGILQLKSSTLTSGSSGLIKSQSWTNGDPIASLTLNAFKARNPFEIRPQKKISIKKEGFDS